MTLEHPVDLPGLGMPFEFLFGIEQFTVHRKLEPAAVRRDDPERFDILRKVLEQFVRQTDGARCVVSRYAVFKFDVDHGGSFRNIGKN
jgi:hypothetical protein